MKNLLAILVLLIVAAAAGADELVCKGMTYAAANVKDVIDSNVQFEFAGHLVSKNVLEIDRITIVGKDSFNLAEDFLAKGDFASAVQNYDLAADRAGDDWLARLIEYRRLRVLDLASQVDRAAAEWLVIMDRFEGSRLGSVFRPTHLAVKGSPANDRAIAALEARLPKVKDNYAQSIKQFLLELYTAQGLKDKASALADELSGSAGDVSPFSSQLKVLASQVEIEPAKALATLDANLRAYSSAELPKALLLRGRAQLQLAAQASPKARRPLLLQAGLNFMRVAAFYPAAAEAAEALYRAALVHRQLDNPAAARAACELLCQRSPSSPWAKLASAELEKWKAEK